MQQRVPRSRWRDRSVPQFFAQLRQIRLRVDLTGIVGAFQTLREHHVMHPLR